MTIYFAKSTLGFYDNTKYTPNQIPADAVEITDATYTSMVEAIGSGKLVVPDAAGAPSIIDKPVIPLTPTQQIQALEASVTPRRLREAVLTGDSTFIKSIDAQISALRATLSKQG
jgi:hypothetical protein